MKFFFRVAQTRNFSSNLSYIHNIGKEPLFYKTIGELVDTAGDRFATRDGIVLCEEGKRLSFKEIKEKVK